MDKNSARAQAPRSAGKGNGEVSHTPGPWHTWRSHGDNSLNVSQVGTNDFVCEVGKLGSDDEERIRADARLIAAAPDLLEALETIAQLQRDKCEYADAETLFMILDSKVSLARAALAKAEGRS